MLNFVNCIYINMNNKTYNNVLKLTCCVSMLYAGATFMSCRDHSFDIEDQYYQTQDQFYEKTFIDAFGSVDPNQTWIPFEAGNVTVSTSAASDIKVFDLSGNLIGQYENVIDTQTLAIDLPVGEKEVIVVSNDMLAKRVNAGGSVSFEGTRALYPGDDVVKISYTADFKDFDKSKITAITGSSGVLPEDKANGNKTGVQKNFGFVSDGSTMVIYPIFWQTSADLTFGIYYKNSEGGIVRVPMCQNRAGNELLQGKRTKNSSYEFVTTANKSSLKYNSSGSVYNAIRSKGIEVKIPEGLVFGLYCEQSDIYFYSKQDDNTCSSNGVKHTHGATYSKDGVDYFSFEDWDNDVFDYNDMIFVIENRARVLDYDAPGFTMAFEDMGSIGDFDFNDVVLQVGGRTSGSTGNTGSLTLAAAGATYAINVVYDKNGDGVFSPEEIVKFNGENEVHAAFGVEQSYMVNTNVTTRKNPITIRNFDFGKNGITNKEIAQRFCLYVVTNGKEDPFEYAETYRKIALPNTEGSVPQGIVVNGLTWSWPSERERITEKYANFDTWVQNYLETKWWNNAANENFTDDTEQY